MEAALLAAAVLLPCTHAAGGQGVTIRSCSYALATSPAGNPNYFINVTIGYATAKPVAAVRFRCAFGNGVTKVTQYGVSRSSGATLTFVSPFVLATPGLQTVECSVDAT
jgi:hypothetical protein